jgi:hypothetical protein
MRLLNTSTFSIDHFDDPSASGGYAIVSHRWAADKFEVKFADFEDFEKAGPNGKLLNRFTRKQLTDAEHTDFGDYAGVYKIARSCQQARQDKLKWIWLDTCCINKTDQQELSISINSVYR